jgi:hypothetical protein
MFRITRTASDHFEVYQKNLSGGWSLHGRFLTLSCAWEYAVAYSEGNFIELHTQAEGVISYAVEATM